MGGAQVLWACLVPQMGFSTPWVAAAVAAILPVAVTGASIWTAFLTFQMPLPPHASREKKLEIMKDSHAGAFAPHCAGVLFCPNLCPMGGAVRRPSRRAEILVGLGYLLSRDGRLFGGVLP